MLIYTRMGRGRQARSRRLNTLRQPRTVTQTGTESGEPGK